MFLQWSQNSDLDVDALSRGEARDMISIDADLSCMNLTCVIYPLTKQHEM